MVRKILIFMFAATLSGFFISPALAYEIGTHAFLTKEIVDFYNKNFPDKKISDDLLGYLIDGSRREDNVPRYFNHFYDPVNNRGLANGIYRGQKSKDWAQDSKSQNKLVYKIIPATVASILTAIQLDKIQPVFSKTNFTWQKAIDLYARGGTEQALFTLGHIIHLLEDTSVPDHTRNDAHPPFDDGGSPYENWTEKFSLENPDKNLVKRLQNKEPILLSALNFYFDGMAGYSNNNFYSKDSIKNYNLPQPDYFEDVGRYLYGFRKDQENGDYKLAVYLGDPDNLNWDLEQEVILTDKQGDLVLPDYWSRLSTKSVQYGAGLVNLFFQEAEKAKAKYELEKAQRPFLARLIDGFGGVFGGESSSINDVIESAKRGGGDFELVAEIPLDAKSNLETSDVSPYEGSPEGRQNIDTNLRTPDVQEIHPPEINEEEPTEPEEPAKATEAAPQVIRPVTNPITPLAPPIQAPSTQAPSVQVCVFNTAQTATRQGAILNEVAWMGSLSSFNDEWLELKNISGSEIDVSGWQILDKAEQIKVQLSGKISAGGFYLLERNSDAVVPGVSADFIYQASGNGAPSLNNTDEGLRLFDKNCNLIDEVFANPDWPAGESNTRRSMERSSDLSWHTYLGGGENGILGTPRKENSLPSSSYNYGGSGGSSQNSGAQNNQATQESASPPAKVLITEAQINPTGSRFIEFYNPNDSSVDLTGWYLQRKTQTGSSFGSLISKTYFENKTINARSYFVISRSALEGADIVLDNLTLTESNTIQLKNPNGDIVDKVGWGEATDCEVNCAPQLLENQSIQRKFQNDTFVDTNNNATDFEIQTCPSPKARSGSCQSAQSNQAPSAFFDYASKDPKVGDLIMFDAASSTDPDGSIAFYQWDFGDGATTTIAQPTIVHAYSAANNYFVQLTVFDNQNASSTATSTVVSVSLAVALSTNVDHVVISEIQIAGVDAGDEFIELYNPTESEIDLSGWSIQYLGGAATSTDNASKKNFEAGNKIAAKGFFLIARAKNSSNVDGYSGNKTPDLTHRTFSMSGVSTGAKIFLVNDQEKISGFDDTNAVDKLDYSFSVPPVGQSLERKALVDNVCVIPWDSSEHLGNGCDTDGSTSSPQDDFELRATSNPQNTQSLPEPRSAPVAVQNLNVAYSPSTLELSFNWPASTGFGNSIVTYRLVDIGSASTTLVIETASTTANKKIQEIGKDYKFEIFAVDRDGLASDIVQETISVPSFINSLAFYEDPRLIASSDYILELDWNIYPFAPIKLKHLVSGQEVPNNWHVVIFYYNQEAPTTDDLFWIDYSGDLPYKSWGLVAPNGFKIKYPNCFGSSRETTGAALILPDTIDQCSGLAGNHASYALDWNQLEDNYLLLNVDDSNFVNAAPTSGQDFLTVAYYAYQPGYEPNNYGLGLIAIDKIKYYLQDSAPVHQPPTAPDNVNFDFNADTSLLKIFWDRSTDLDTLDNLIMYEVKYGLTLLTTSEDFVDILVEPNETYDFELRAMDEFGNYSEVIDVSYDVPDMPMPYGISDIAWGNLNEGNFAVLNLEFESYPFVDTSSPGAMIFFLNQMPPTNYSFLDDDYRNGLQIGGANSVLELFYQPCDYNGTWNNKVNAAGLIFNNDECPVQSHLAMSKLLLAKLSTEDTSFTAEVINQMEFSDSDYITIGFYQLGERDINGAAYFTNTVNYNKKIYFQQ